MIFLCDQTFFSTASLKVHFFSDLIKSKQFFSQQSNTKQFFDHLFHLILHKLQVLEVSPHLPGLSTVIFFIRKAVVWNM